MVSACGSNVGSPEPGQAQDRDEVIRLAVGDHVWCAKPLGPLSYYLFRGTSSKSATNPRLGRELYHDGARSDDRQSWAMVSYVVY